MSDFKSADEAGRLDKIAHTVGMVQSKALEVTLTNLKLKNIKLEDRAFASMVNNTAIEIARRYR